MTTPTPNPVDALLDELRRYLDASTAITTLIRRYVPLLVGTALAYAAVHWHIVLPKGADATAVQVVTALLIAGWFALVTWVERRWPWLGRWLVSAGLRLVPVYAAPETVEKLRATTPRQ